MVSFKLSKALGWSGCEDLGLITLHLDGRRRPFEIEIHNASRIVSTLGLLPLRETPITHEEISRRMAWSAAGREAWSAIVRRMLLPHQTARPSAQTTS